MSANFTITGKLHSGTATEQKTESFSVRFFVLEITDGNYTSHAQFQLVNKNTALLSNFKKNEMVTVTFNVGGRLWNSPEKGEMCFTTLNAWKMEASQQPQQASNDWGAPAPAPAPVPVPAQTDELPF